MWKQVRECPKCKSKTDFENCQYGMCEHKLWEHCSLESARIRDAEEDQELMEIVESRKGQETIRVNIEDL